RCVLTVAIGEIPIPTIGLAISFNLWCRETPATYKVPEITAGSTVSFIIGCGSWRRTRTWAINFVDGVEITWRWPRRIKTFASVTGHDRECSQTYSGSCLTGAVVKVERVPRFMGTEI